MDLGRVKPPPKRVVTFTINFVQSNYREKGQPKIDLMTSPCKRSPAKKNINVLLPVGNKWER